MRTQIKDILVIPMTSEGLHFIGDIYIRDGIIEAVGSGIKAPGPVDEVVNGQGKVVIPGLVNAHTHLSMTLMRNYKDTCANLQDWLSEIFPIEDRLTEEDIYWGSMTGLAELVRSGCTSFADMYFKQWMTAQACKEAGVRGFLSLTLFGDEAETEDRLAIERLDEAIKGVDILRKDIAVHSIYTCTAGSYRLAAEWAKEHGSIVNTHLSETKKEMDDCLAQHGCLPAQWLEDTGFFDVPCYTAHGVWLQDSELDILRRHDVAVVHNPSSNCKLASGIAPVRHFMDSGLTIALGTDGASSNNNLSMLKEMRLAAMISTVSTLRVDALTPYKVLEMATLNGAKALRADDKIGTIEPGKDADLAILDMDRVNTCPVNDIFSALVFSLNEGNVSSVYVKGRKLMEDGQLLTINEAEVIRENRRCWKRLCEE